MGSTALSPVGHKTQTEPVRAPAPERAPEPAPARHERAVDVVGQAVQEAEQRRVELRVQREAELHAAQERRLAGEQLLGTAIRRTMIECQLQGVSTSEAILHVSRVQEHFLGYL